MNFDVSNCLVCRFYRSPEILNAGSVLERTGAGGEKVVDAWGPDGHTAIDWNKHNSLQDEPDDEINVEAL